MAVMFVCFTFVPSVINLIYLRRLVLLYTLSLLQITKNGTANLKFCLNILKNTLYMIMINHRLSIHTSMIPSLLLELMLELCMTLELKR